MGNLPLIQLVGIQSQLKTKVLNPDFQGRQILC